MNAKKKENQNKKIDVCQLHNKMSVGTLDYALY